VKHNQQNSSFRFQLDPADFDKDTDKELLQYCLGGTLYMPGTRRITDRILSGGASELTSMVMCFEDAVKAEDVPDAEDNVLEHLSRIADALEGGQIDVARVPLTFLRVRTSAQFQHFAQRLTKRQATVLSGFVFPKFYSTNATEYLDQLVSLNDVLGTRLYGMPILEGSAIAYREMRVEELHRLKELLQPYRDFILNIRVGGTDFSSLFGVRRDMYSSIYDILPVRDALSDILNFFNRAEDTYTVSGPVWEYFLAHKQDDVADLLRKPIHQSLMTRQPILNPAIDGLLREVVLDKANGFVGKTVIHPSHLRFVNAMQAVTLEEYEDAMQILDAGGGVAKSPRGNKMNEANPHRTWASQTVMRAKAYGVIGGEEEYMHLLLTPDSTP